jgi:RHS repeat-associated protein
MKLAKLLQCFVIICAFSNLLAQTGPNIENGWKPYGSYDGSHLDTVNLMNGNVMLHVPILPAYQQRGSFTPQYSLYMTSKTWQIQSKAQNEPGIGTILVYWWQSSATGVMVISNTGILVRRNLVKSFAGNGSTLYNTQSYSLTGPDASVHAFNAVPGYPLDASSDPTVFEAVDGSGYHLVVSNADSNGVMSTATVTDRNGTQFQGAFSTDYTDFSTRCTRPGTIAIPTVGPYAPIYDDLPLGDMTCPQFAFAQVATDSNGNQINFRTTGPQTPPIPSTDTLGRNMPFSFIPANPGVADSSKCVSLGGQPISSTDLAYYNAPDGTTRSIQRCYAILPIQTAFGVSGVAEAESGGARTATTLVTVIQADGSKWVFNYDSYVNLTYIGLPTGGSISYTWTTVALPACPGNLTVAGRAVKTRTLTDNMGHSSQWTYNWGAPGTTLSNTVTDPAGNDTVHVFTALDGFCAFYETSTKYFQGTQAGQPSKQVDTGYSPNTIVTEQGIGNVVATSIKTTLNPSGKVNLVTKQYDAGFGSSSPIFGNVIKEQEFDWGLGAPGALLRETDTVYQWQKDSNFLNAHLVDLPASTVVISPLGAANVKANCPITATTNANCAAETDYSYDEPTYLATPSPAVTIQHVSPPNNVRGNQTTVSRWLNTTNGFIPSHVSWYDTGEPFQKIDPLGHITTLSYDPAYVGGYVTQTCSPQTGSVAHCVSGTYDFNTGVLTSLTNENATTQASGNTFGDAAHTSNYTYDYMFRITSAQAPPDPANGGSNAQTSFIFSAPNVFPLSVQRTKSITTSLNDSATSFFDGLGRAYQTQHVLPGGTATVDTHFDLAGHPDTVSNPYFSTADPTYGATTNLYDALDRVYQTKKQDGSISSVSYDQAAPGVAGVCTIATDEAGKFRRACSDALGRLTEVDEPNPGAAASYAQATVSISGSEQANPLPGAPGGGYVDISGSEGSTQSCTDPEPPAHPVCVTAPDSGTVWIQVGTYPAKSVTYGVNSTASSVASALATAFHNDAAAPADAAVSPTIPTRILFTARTLGLATNYSLSVSAPSDFWPTASGANFTGGRDNSSSPDTGSVTITVNGTPYQTTYGGSDTASSIATRLASAITAGSWANASASGATVTITAKSTGPGGDYTVSASDTYDSAHFGQPSFTPAPSASALSGGYDASAIDNQPFRTLYTYDALGNLLRVDQKGTAPNDSTQWRTRTFTYDSLSRLLTANNPESGTITYSYDADGNLLQKTSPAPNQTGTAMQTVSFCYDELHRVTGKGYGAQSCPLSTPVVTYAYDSGANAKGKLTSLTDQAGTASYSYDILGRLTAETRTLTGANNASISKNLSYEYNLDGSLYKLHYPSGAVVTYEPGAAGLTLSAKDSGNNISYVTSATYGPDSALTGFVSGYSTSFAGITNKFLYTPRLQPCRMIAATSGTLPVLCGDAAHGNVLDLGYDFHLGNGTSGSDNGNVYGITNYKDTTRNQTFTYDALNRLISAQNAGTDCTVNVLNGNKKFWGNTYSYDAWGNLLNKTKIGAACAGENLSLTADGHNWIHATGGSDYLYDAAGNMTFNATPPTQTYTYDQENRLTGAAGYTYTYDSDGNRVRKSNSSTGTLYWYMTPGIVGESDLSGNLTDEYVFFDGERVARKSTNGVFYYFSDHLKTASVITDASGNIKSESDFYPWGGELQFVSNDSNHYKFTGKERDSETQLDYFGARYYSNGLGRWISADWSPTPIPVPYADFYDPQTLNLYQFVGGNPASKADPDGHEGPGSYEGMVAMANSIGDRFAEHFNAIKNAMSGPELPHPESPGFEVMKQRLQQCPCPSNQKQEDSKQNNNNSKSSNQSESGGQDKKVPNPDGSKGAPDHQQTAEEERMDIGEKGQQEVRVDTPGGEKGYRKIDAAKVENGKVTEARQVIRPNKDGTPPAREVRAARDIQKATGVTPKMVPVRPKTPE